MVYKLCGMFLGLCMAGAASAGGPQDTSGVLLSPAQMDVVTAGGSAAFGFGAEASSRTFASTLADGATSNRRSMLTGQSHQQSEVAVAAGHANAVALGQNSSAASAVAPSSSVTQGPIVYSSQFELTIPGPDSSMSMGWSYKSTTTADPHALSGR